MAIGRPPQPLERRRLLGNPGKRKLPKGNLVALQPAISVVSVAAEDGDGLVVAILATAASAWIAEPDRLGILELVRDGWDERLRLRQAIEALPPDWVASRYTPAVFLRLERVERSLTTWFSLLGLTPADRSRLGVAEVKARSRLEGLRARRDTRSRAG